MRFAVLGAGGVGAWLGARLQQAGFEVVFIARGAHGDALRGRGLVLEVRGGAAAEDRVVLENVRVFSDIAAAAASGVRVDCCVLCVKTFQVRDAAAECAPILEQTGGFVVTTQNGVAAPIEAAAALGAARVVAGSCRVLSYIESPGNVVMQERPADWTFGEVYGETGEEVQDARSPRVEALLAAASKAVGIKAAIGEGEPVPSMWRALWAKAVTMCSMGPVSALTRAPMDAILACEPSRRMLRSAMLEVISVASAKGVCVTEDPEALVNARMEAFQKTSRGSTTSTLRDIVTGKRSEILELSGAIVAAASEVGVPVPTQEFILAALLPQERRARGEHSYELEGVPGGAPHVRELAAG